MHEQNGPMTSPQWVDEFGLPRRVLSKSDDFYAALGRIAAVAAIVEMRMSVVVEEWGFTAKFRGESRSVLVRQFKRIVNDRTQRGVYMPTELVAAFAAAASALERRNEVLHSLWPPTGVGWRNRPDGSEETTINTRGELRDLIRQLVDASDGLSNYLGTPIEK